MYQISVEPLQGPSKISAPFCVEKAPPPLQMPPPSVQLTFQ